VDRARRGVTGVPAEAALGGFSMGVGVIGELWPQRADAAAVFCLHAPTTVPDGVGTGTPVQLHVAAGDPFAPADQIAAFRASAVATRAAASV
jgi:dienelactone hydrolase